MVAGRPSTLPLLLALALALGGTGGARAEETAAAVTERGRGLDRILDLVLAPGTDADDAGASVLFLLDPTPSLVSADLPARLGRALARRRTDLVRTRVAVTSLEARERVAWVDAGQPSAARELEQRAAALLEGARDDVRNVYAAARAAAGDLRRQAGRRALVLVTLENGDAEDDVEGTATNLRQVGARVTVVAREAFLADTYWQGHAPPAAARDLDLAGGDAAFVDLPWGWLFQQAVANEHVPSGHAMYGLTRLATATGGRVFLYYPPSAAGHACSPYGTCPFCRGDHLPQGEAYQPQRVRAIAPPSVSRREALQAGAHDPLLRAVLRAWEDAGRAGLVHSRPSVKVGPGGLLPQRPGRGRLAPLGGTLALPSQAARAERLAQDLDGILPELEAAIAKAGPEDATERWRATAEATATLLRVTRLNLHLFAGFCREVGPAWLQGEPDLQPPEIPQYPPGTRFTGIGFTNLSLCHGVRPFLELDLPGGAPVRAELEDLAGRVEAFLARWAHTPYAAVVRRAGLARFHLLVRGTYVPPPKRKIPGHDEPPTETPPERPSRGSTPSSGGGGPTSGGD